MASPNWIDRLDHLVITVRDIPTTCAFYERVLGMEARPFDGDKWALHFAQQKINLHQAGREFEPKATTPLPGSADLCFITVQPIDEFARHLAAEKVDILEGPVARTGAQGPMTSIYFRDPDGNLLEVSEYK